MKQVVLAASMVAALAAPASGSSYDNLNAGIQLYNFGQWSDAVLALDKALAANDLVPSLQFIAHYDRAWAHLHLAHYDLAIADYSASLSLRPGETEVLVNRSLTYLNSGKLEQAAADLDAVIAAHPQLAQPYGVRAAVNLKRGQMDKSREDMKTLLKLLPETTKRGNGIGIINWEIGQVGDAEDNFSYEASHGPNNIYAWLWYTLTEVRLGKNVPRRSLPDFDKTAWPAPIIRFFLGDIPQDTVFTAARQGDADATKGQICEANFYIGEWLMQRHDLAGAKPLMAKAASDCPTNFIEWSPAQMDLVGLP